MRFHTPKIFLFFLTDKNNQLSINFQYNKYSMYLNYREEKDNLLMACDIQLTSNVK